MRFVVVGTSGSGKSVFAESLAEVTGGRYIELDALYWCANWAQRPRAEFIALVTQAACGERWVADGNYAIVRDVLWSRATHVVWLNFGRAVVFTRIVRRTLRRAIGQQELWHGNRESLSRALLSRQSILLWSFTTFAKNRAKFQQLRASGGYPHLEWAELQHPSAAARYLALHAETAG